MTKPFVAVLVATDTEFAAARRLLEEQYRMYTQFGISSLEIELDETFLIIQKLPQMGTWPQLWLQARRSARIALCASSELAFALELRSEPSRVITVISSSPQRWCTTSHRKRGPAL